MQPQTGSGLFYRKPFGGPGFVGLISTMGFESPGIQILPNMSNSGVVTTNPSACAIVGGCSLTYGNASIRVEGATIGTPEFSKGIMVLTFYDATF